MPDIYSTAGWATSLYDASNLDLRNEPWAANLEPAIKAIITNNSGKLECLPIDEQLICLVYNVDLLNKYSINPDTLKTWDGFLNACKTIKTQSNDTVKALFVGGGDGWPIGVLINYMATPEFMTSANKDVAALKNGTFDWNKWTTFATQINTLFKSGYLNNDFETAKNSDITTSIAQGKTVFDFGFNNFLSAQKLNPNLKYSVTPIPAMVAGDSPVFSGGEDTTLAISKNSKCIDDCRLFLRYMAEPANIEFMCNILALPAGFTGVPVTGFDSAKIQSFNARLMPVFDRTCLPNGMWDYMNNNAAEMARGSITPAQYSDIMKTNYLRLLKAASSSK
jgi:raffinose/stachyose/melibiose transport system substrate-binding protein